MGKKGIYAGIAALMMMVFSHSALAATMDMDFQASGWPTVYYEVDGANKSVRASEFDINLTPKKA
jgi:hypothetical protein